MRIRKTVRRIIVALVITSLLFTQYAPAYAAQIHENTNNDTVTLIDEFSATKNVDGIKQSATPKAIPEYSEMMDKIQEIKKEGKEISEFSKQVIKQEVNSFIKSEQKKLKELKVPQKRINEYVNLLEYQRDNLEEAIIEEDASDLKIPKNPSTFSFSNKKIKVKNIVDWESYSQFAPINELKRPNKDDVTGDRGLIDEFKGLFTIKDTEAATNENDMPTLADLKADDQEVIIDSKIEALAKELRNNPVEIYNYVRNNITYEPYYGAKKGSAGCLKEKVCNDVDTASLTIALLRASGIPARYKKSLTLVSVDQLKNLLGVDENKTIYAALAQNDIPIFRVSGVAITDLDLADLTAETHFAVQWVLGEVFYEYDERGANIDNEQSFSEVTTDADLKAELLKYPKKQWIPFDTIFKSYTRTKKDILVDTASMNIETFWTDYFKYQGSLSPLEKYKADLKTATNKEVKDYLSTLTLSTETADFIPNSLPYALGSGTYGGGVINPETFSSLDDRFRTKVKISLLKESDRSSLFSKTFYGSDVNNKPLNLYYEGATAADKTVIEQYGGLHKTPSNLVDIKPYLTEDYADYLGGTTMEIGNALILQLEYSVNGNIKFIHEKFSTAGNQEGIYVVLSRVQQDSTSNDNQKILLAGNAALAKEFLIRTEESGDELAKSLDYYRNTNYSAAIVTQSRILTRSNGIPTTFKFKGLNIDVAHYVNDFSRRGNYKNHRKDFRLLFGENSSYYEGQLFTDIVGLNGISTTKGLQYAYSKPTEYTIHTITSANKPVIDTLSFSTNTKNNMKADVDKGYTIITPNKPVTNDNWNGIFYVSKETDGSAMYAIGEQVAGNGGSTIEQFTEKKQCDAGSQNPECAEYSEVEKTTERIGFADGRESRGKTCRISKTEYDSIQNSSSWKNSYGFPCYKADGIFGTYEHTYVVSSEAIKFYKPNAYNFWIKDAQAEAILDRDTNSHNSDVDSAKLLNPGLDVNELKLNNARLDGNFKFNHIAGTFSKYGHYDGNLNGDYEEDSWDFNECITSYFNPTSGGGEGKIVYGHVLKQLSSQYYDPPNYICAPNNANCGKNQNNDLVLSILGFPLNNRHEATDSIIENGGTTGYEQSFADGDIYVKSEEDELGNRTYYVPQTIEDAFKFSNYCKTYSGETHCGTGGKFGFPISSPEGETYGTVSQIFESGDTISCANNSCSVTYDPTKNTVAPVNPIYSSGTFKEHFIEGAGDAASEMSIYGYVINFSAGAGVSRLIKKITGIIMKKAGKKTAVKVSVRFIPFIGWAYTAVTGTIAALDSLPLAIACAAGSVDGKSIQKNEQAYYCGKLGVKGAAFIIGFAAERISSKLYFRVKTTFARKAKERLFGRVKNDMQMDRLDSLFKDKRYGENKTDFCESIKDLTDADIDMILEDDRLLEHLFKRPKSFNTKYKMTKVRSGNDANLTDFDTYTNPHPFPPGSHVTELEITDAVINNEFVRFHTNGNVNRPWLVHIDDIPYKNGKIDVVELKARFAIPANNVIDAVSFYKPVKGDILIEGAINTGTDPNLLQYGIKGLFDLPKPEQLTRFELDQTLTNLIK